MSRRVYLVEDWKHLRACRVCGGPFMPKSPAHALCSKACRYAEGRERALAYYYAVKAEAAEPEEPAPPPPRLACVECAYWRPLPLNVSELGGFCAEEVFRACNPWSASPRHIAPLGGVA